VLRGHPCIEHPQQARQLALLSADESSTVADVPGWRLKGLIGATTELVKEESERDCRLGDD